MSKRTKNSMQYFVISLLIIPMLACGGTSVPATPAVIVEASVSPQDITPIETAIPDSTSLPVGSSPQNPASRTDTVSTSNWEFYVVEVHRGDDAMAFLKETSAFNKDHPDPSMEYVLVKVHAKYVGTDADKHRIDSSFFRGMDSNKVLYDRIKSAEVKSPDPSISSFDDLTLAGEVEGWVVIQVKRSDPGSFLVIWPRDNGLALGDETMRYILLDS